MHTSMHRQLYQLHHCDKSTVHSTCIETGCYANQGVVYFHHVGIAPNHTAISSQLHSCSLGSGNVPAWVLVVAQEVCDVYWLRWVLPGMRPKGSLPDYLRHLGTTSPPKLSLHMYMYFNTPGHSPTLAADINNLSQCCNLTYTAVPWNSYQSSSSTSYPRGSSCTSCMHAQGWNQLQYV